MDNAMIIAKLVETEKKFTDKQTETESYRQKVVEGENELNRLQGEYRILVELRDTKDQASTVVVKEKK